MASYLAALFSGRYTTSAAAAEPVDSGTPYVPNPAHFPTFLNNLPRLTQEERNSLKLSFTLPELAAAMDETAPNKSTGLDGLSYEFYRTTLPLIGPSILAALNAMLENGLLTPPPFVVVLFASFPKSLLFPWPSICTGMVYPASYFSETFPTPTIESPSSGWIASSGPWALGLASATALPPYIIKLQPVL